MNLLVEGAFVRCGDGGKWAETISFRTEYLPIVLVTFVTFVTIVIQRWKVRERTARENELQTLDKAFACNFYSTSRRSVRLSCLLFHSNLRIVSTFCLKRDYTIQRSRTCATSNFLTYIASRRLRSARRFNDTINSSLVPFVGETIRGARESARFFSSHLQILLRVRASDPRDTTEAGFLNFWNDECWHVQTRRFYTWRFALFVQTKSHWRADRSFV